MPPLKRVYYLFFGFVLLIAAPGVAQQVNLYEMSTLPQQAYLNPAFMPQARISIGLPVLSSLYAGATNSGFRYKDLIQRGSDDSLHLHVDNMLGKLKKNNFFDVGVQPDLFSFGLRLKKMYIGFNVTEKVEVRFQYSKDFMNFFWKGNAAFLGDQINLGLGLNAIHYREYGLSLARPINKKFTVGAKLKYLYGMEDISTKKSDVRLKTASNDYAITTTANVLINTAGLDSNSFNNFSFPKYAFGKKNKGLGLDMGGTYQLTSKISLSASILDLGYIKWKTGVSNYVSDHPGSEFTYQGVDLQSVINDSATFSDVVNKVLDTLSTTFKIDTLHQTYTTMLSPRFYVGGNMKLNKFSNAGGLIYATAFKKKVYPALCLTYAIQPWHWLMATASYAIYNRSYGNFGLGFSIKGGPIQFYAVSDNIIGDFLPQNVKNVNIRFGINLLFGKVKAKKKDEAQIGSDGGGSEDNGGSK